MKVNIIISFKARVTQTPDLGFDITEPSIESDLRAFPKEGDTFEVVEVTQNSVPPFSPVP